MSETKRSSNVKLAWAKKTKLGFWSEDIGPGQFEAFQQIKLGGRLSLKSVPCKDKEGRTFEGFVFEFIPPETVATFKEKSPRRPVERDDDL